MALTNFSRILRDYEFYPSFLGDFRILEDLRFLDGFRRSGHPEVHGGALVKHQGVKALKKFGFFTSGGQTNSLK